MEQLKGGGKEPLMMSGPKFGNKGGGWLGRNRSNVILSIIGILIIAGGIYLYSNYQKSNEAGIIEEETTQEQSQEGAVKPEQVNIGGQTGQSSQTNQPGQQTSTAPAASATEVTNFENAKFTVKAGKGAGITHLARAAAKEYLEAHPELKQNVTPEHKIYIEDYIKDKTGSYGLAIGQELTFDEGLIKEAIDSSQKLDQAQLQNLHKYVLLVPSLSG